MARWALAIARQPEGQSANLFVSLRTAHSKGIGCRRFGQPCGNVAFSYSRIGRVQTACGLIARKLSVSKAQEPWTTGASFSAMRRWTRTGSANRRSDGLSDLVL